MDLQQALEPNRDRDWLLVEQSYDPLRESSIESRFTVSNGFLGVRAAREISRGPTWVSWSHTLRWASWPRTYVAGLFDTPNIEPPVPALVPVADWLRVRVLLNGRRPAATQRRYAARTSGSSTCVGARCSRSGGSAIPAGLLSRCKTLRLVSLADRALGLQLVRLEVEQANAEITVDARFDESGSGWTRNTSSRISASGAPNSPARASPWPAPPRLQLDDAELSPQALSPFRWSWSWTSAPGQAASFQRLIAVARGDRPAGDPGNAGAGRARANAADRLARRACRT